MTGRLFTDIMLRKEDNNMTFLDLCKSRYSTRKFSDKPIEQEKLNYILEAGRIAPTGRNYQPQKVYVIKSPEAIAKVREAAAPMAYNAPMMLVVGYDKNISAKATPWGEDYDLGESDAVIVATSMMYAAEDVGIGTLWARGFNTRNVAKALNLPDNIEIVCLLDLGYSISEPAPKHFERNALDETVTIL